MPKRIVGALLITAVLALDFAHAEIPRRGLRQLQDQAPEVLMIRVIKVTESCSPGGCTLDVGAEVHCVGRSHTNLKASQAIQISYVTFVDRPGSPVPRVAEGALYPAFLAHGGPGQSVYRPVAGSASFSDLIDPHGAADRAVSEAICRP